MIGIGVTTYNRPGHIANWQSQIAKHTADKHTLHIYNDSHQKRGIAYGKNDCLRSLRDCEYVFLFDDDSFPVNDGWVEHCISMHEKTGNHHFLYLLENRNLRIIGESEYMYHYNNCGGVFLFLTRAAVAAVGGMHPDYGRYGFEHAGYSQRIHKAGLTESAYITPKLLSTYLYAMDYQSDKMYNKYLRHAPSLINELQQLPAWLQEAKKVYEKDIEQINQPL